MIKIREQTAKLLEKDFGIPPEVTWQLFEEGLLAEHICRNVLIKKEYTDKAQPKEKQRTRARIAEKYCVSVKLIERITYS